jgi:cellulose synthase/poly-beta-1,6-N-acetylglucosamine synthase-like glycosyltransferase
MIAGGKIVIAIPVKNEETLILSCLAGLEAQTRAPDDILLLLNDCTDLTLAICTEMQRTRPNIKIQTCVLPAALASAGEARRRALDQALRLTNDGLILTTDADAFPGRSWIADNVAEVEAGADVVCGMIEIDEADTPNVTRRLELDDMREKLLLKAIDEVIAITDPEPADPWPRHQQNSGASIAVKATLLRQVGGAPHVSVVE